ncbi:MAG: hypothetical protein AAB446_00745 [Patescibacteria group bacterium]
MSSNKKILLLLGYVLVAGLFVFIFKPTYLISIILVLVPPALTNWLWLKKSKLKILIFSLTTAIIIAPAIELCARLADVWDVQSVIIRPFGLIPIENMIFAFLNFLWVLSFYEYFVDKDSSKKISPRLKLLTAIYIFGAATIYTIFFINKDLVTLNYFSISIPLLFIPAIIIFWNKPALMKKVILPTLFFALIFFYYEIISLIVGSWWWPGEYLFKTYIFGKVFPLDDVIIWYFLSTPVLIGGYEFFTDDFR